MYRDVINALHYLFQLTELSEKDFDNSSDQSGYFWTGLDTKDLLKSDNMIISNSKTKKIKMQNGLFKFIKEVEDQLSAIPKPDYVFGYPLSNDVRSKGNKRPAFLAISYTKKFEKIKLTIVEAAKKANFKCEVTGDLFKPGIIIDQVWQNIREAEVVIADVTGKNPNVLYEIGLAHSLGKEVIIITQKQKTPFDIRSLRHIEYNGDDLDGLKRNLIKAFKSVSPRYPFDGPRPRT